MYIAYLFIKAPCKSFDVYVLDPLRWSKYSADEEIATISNSGNNPRKDTPFEK